LPIDEQEAKFNIDVMRTKLNQWNLPSN
jgi:hypothetical protein